MQLFKTLPTSFAKCSENYRDFCPKLTEDLAVLFYLEKKKKMTSQKRLRRWEWYYLTADMKCLSAFSSTMIHVCFASYFSDTRADVYWRWCESLERTTCCGNPIVAGGIWVRKCKCCFCHLRSTLTFERGDFGGKNLGITQHLILIRVVVVKTLSKIFKNVLALRPTISFLKMLCCRIEGALTACLASSLALHRNNHTVSNTQIRRNVIKKPSRWAANSFAFYKH